MNKFLNLTFKIGKIFSSILLVIVLLVMVGSGISLLTSNYVSLKTPNFNTVKELYTEDTSSPNANTGSNVNQSNTRIDRTAPYMKQILNIVRKNHLKDETQYLITKNINKDIDTELINQYLQGLDKFYKDGLRHIEKSPKFKNDYIFSAIVSVEGRYVQPLYEDAIANIKVNGLYNYYIGAGLTNDYHDLFKEAIGTRVEQLQSKAIAKITQQIVLAISVLLFAILLFLPVLIKIEENTRPAEEREETKKEEDMKPCISCGKLIKTTAKKCRHCGTWQNDTEENNGGEQ